MPEQKHANARPSVAVIGCGYWGRNLVRNFHELDALVAVSDADPRRAEEFGKKYGLPALSVAEILASDGIDGVVVAAPAEMHATLCLQALEAGKHVFVEKPLALRISDAERVIALARKVGRSVMVGHLLQYHPAFLRLKALVAEGRLGRLQYIYSNRLNLGKIRREENVFWSFAPHDLSMILALAGELPEAVQATGASYLHKVIEDVTTTHLSFPSGLHAHVFVSWLHPFKEQKLVVVGERAMAVFDDRQPWDGKLLLYPHSIEWRDGMPEPNPAEAEPVALDEAEPLKLECRHFLDCIRTGAVPRTDGEEGLRVLRVLDAAERAMTGRRIVPLQPASAQDPSAEAKPDFWMHESAYVDDGCTVGAGTRIWHFSHVIKGSRIGRNCTIGQNAMIGPDVTVGNNCKIQNNVSVYKGVTLEDGVFCGPSCVFTNVNNPRAEVGRKDEFRPTHVGRGATIGANATIVCGTRLGAYSFVAAGAVVAKDVPPHALVAGVPARRIGWMSHDGERLDNHLTCPRSGRRYRLAGDETLVEITEPEEA